jgi:hypothetical protein
MRHGAGTSPLARIWRGEYPLWLTYWVFGVGGNMSLLGLLAVGWLATAGLPWPPATAETPAPAAWAMLWVVWGIAVAWHGFTFRATWRAGDAYTGPRIWVVLSRVGFAIGYPRLALEALFLTGVLF